MHQTMKTILVAKKGDDPDAAPTGRCTTKRHTYALIALLALNAMILYRPAGDTIKTTMMSHCSATPKTPTTGWIRPDVVYGLVHVAKMAGPEINGE
jgi:hypothetical protein